MGQVMVIRFNYHNFKENGCCELTEEMDKYLLHKSELNYTYIQEFGKREDGKEGFVYVLRAPGATRGCIITDQNNIIESINFYKDTCYDLLNTYDRKMEEIKEKYIGREIITFKP